uniref:Preprotein translocase subunit Y n=1 Tax=Nitzschia sp. NIES-3576 TaxID=2083273 RepID=A0A2Z5ZBC5_9STRA|nr:preprotein translocase subunit Y [Nitzschia sp. NIES-3576]
MLKRILKKINKFLFGNLRINRKIITTILKKLLITITILSFIIIGDLLPISGIHSKFIYSFFQVGIYPYVNAGTIIYFYVFFSPKLKKLKNENDPHIFKFMEKYTKILTIFLILIKSFFNALSLKKYVSEWTFSIFFDLFTSLFAGATILLWFSELITKYGLGNGNSVIGSFRIIKELIAIFLYYLKNNKNVPNVFEKIIFLSILFIIFQLSFFLIELHSKIPLILGERLEQLEIQKKFKFYFPLLLNQGGIFSLSFSASILNLFPRIKAIEIDFFYFIFLFILSVFFNIIYTLIIIDIDHVINQFQKESIINVEYRPIIRNTFLLELVQNGTIGPFFSIILSMLPIFITMQLKTETLLYIDPSEIYSLLSSLSSVYIDIESIYFYNVSI